jgi:hypothetical protein
VTSTLQTRTAWAVTFVTVVLLTLSRALLPGQQWQLTVEFITAALGNALLILACAGVGLLIISRQPGNVIGWCTPWSPSSLPPASSPVATPPDHCLPKFGAIGPRPGVDRGHSFGRDAAAVAVPRRSAALAALAPGRLTIGVAGGLALVAAACYPGPLDVASLVKDAEVTARLTNPLGVATPGQLFEPFLLRGDR